MKKKLKKHLVELYRKRTSYGRDLDQDLCLDRNERVIPFPDDILRELQATITSAVLRYYPETTRLHQKLAKFLAVKEEEVYFVNGISECIRVIFETLVNPGDDVVVVEPTFPMYMIYSKVYQCRHVPVGFTDDLKVKWDELYAAINDKTAFVVVATPNLPIEYHMTLAEIRKLAKKCLEHNTFLIVDEAYGFFGSETAISLLKEFENIIVFQTFSKAAGLAGIRFGYMVSQAENIEYLGKTRSLVETDGPTMAFAEYMIDHWDIVEDHVNQVAKGREYIKKELDRLGLKWQGGQYANAILIFLENREAVNDLVQYLKDRHIQIRASFEGPLNRTVRITLAPVKELSVFIKNLEEWLKIRSAVTTASAKQG